MTDDAISLETQGDHLHVRGARAHFKLLAMKPQDFPPFPEASEAEPFLVKATDLRRMVGQTAFAASRENSQYARASVLIRVAPGKLKLAATDARRRAEATCGVETTTEAEATRPCHQR
jgi:DNA polymerase III sliding clamp (beta) subunit (PCNA family)